MHALLSNLTALSLLIHALLGCCWHHGHSETCASSHAKASTCCSHKHEKPQGGGKESEPTEHSDQKCEGETCVFARTETQSDIDIELAPAFESQFFQAKITTPCIFKEPPAELYSPPVLLPPVRSHLLHRILLI